jgi:periplasmic glucans biosynthesis protein
LIGVAIAAAVLLASWIGGFVTLLPPATLQRGVLRTAVVPTPAASQRARQPPPTQPPPAQQPQPGQPPPPAQQSLLAQEGPPAPQPSPAAQRPAAQNPPAAAAAPRPFTYADVVQLARERAAQPYHDPSPRLPARLAHLTYDQYQDIRFRPHFALWRDQSLFEVQFFHRGFNFGQRVEISEVVDGVVHSIHYNPNWFDFGKLAALAKGLPTQLGFAGFRIHYPLQTATYKDELIVFLGASYFRVLGRNEVYGLSARGLAVDTASTKGEEFPWFTDFWLVKPGPLERTLTIYALLDSKSIAGAYEFDVQPGGATQVTVTSELFPRKDIAKLGVAPLTSMFLYGEDPSGHRFDDYRPEVHDSDGLMIQSGSGEWMWRPLLNPPELEVNRFMDQHPLGFGLEQRDRDFNHYQDGEAQFERRPSYWVQPLGDWGKGGVELVEIPTDEEIHDNIVAYWVPSEPVEGGKPLQFRYLLTAYLRSPIWPPGGRVIATRTGDFSINGTGDKPEEGARRVMIDYAGGDLDGLEGSQPVKATISANGGRVDRVSVQRLPENGAWRVEFRVVPATPKLPVDLRCYLTLYGEALTETWIYQLKE